MLGLFAVRWRWKIENPTLKLLLVVSVLVVVQFVLLATDKPAEYARFALLPSITFWIVMFKILSVVLPRMRGRRARVLLPVPLALMVGLFGASYLWHFVDDSKARTTRIVAAERLRKLAPKIISVAAEPAPYCMPPVNLFTTRLILHSPAADVSIRTVDDVESRTNGEFWGRPRLINTPISWRTNRSRCALIRRLPFPRRLESVILLTMQGVTTALVAFIFFCVIFPERVNVPQFYAALGMICAILLLDAINYSLAPSKFAVFSYFATAFLQIGAILVLFMAAGGLSWHDLKGELGNAYEVIRRGGDEKEIIIPLTGAKPRPRDVDDDVPPERINIDSPAPKPPGDQIPLE